MLFFLFGERLQKVIKQGSLSLDSGFHPEEIGDSLFGITSLAEADLAVLPFLGLILEAIPGEQLSVIM